MRFVYKILFIPAIAIPLAIASAIYFAVDQEAMVRRAADVTPANIQRAKAVIEQNNPLRIRAGNRASASIGQQDLDLAANYLAYFYANGSARLTLNNGSARLLASLRPPWFPVIFYFNVTAVLVEGAPIPQFEQVRVGRLEIPSGIANWLAKRALTRLLGADAIETAAGSIKQVRLKNAQLLIAYEWQSKQRDAPRPAVIPPQEQERLYAYHQRLALITKSPKAAAVSLSELLVALFELAEVRSQSGGEAVENRAAILALAFYLDGEPLETVLPAAKQWPRLGKRTVTLNGRDDAAKHFIVSAALAAGAGGPFSKAVDVSKEIEDSRGGSGFSFVDIAADRAGTRFGEQAVTAAAAKKIRQKISAGITEKEIMPATQDLPESMPRAEFKRRYGSVDALELKKIMAEIERRVAALPLYR